MCLAIPGKVVELLAERENLGLVEVGGVRRKIDLGLLIDDPAAPGDWVLIHVGFAMSKISEEGAAEQMRILAMLGESEAAMQEIEGYGLGEHENEAASTRTHSQDHSIASSAESRAPSAQLYPQASAEDGARRIDLNPVIVDETGSVGPD